MLSTQKQKLISEVADLKAKIHSGVSTLSIQNKRLISEVDHMKSTVIAAKQQASLFKKEVTTLSTQKQKLISEVADLKAKIHSGVSTGASTLSVQNKRLIKEVAEMKTALKEYRRQNWAYAKEVRMLSVQKQKLSSEVAEMKAKMQTSVGASTHSIQNQKLIKKVDMLKFMLEKRNFLYMQQARQLDMQNHELAELRKRISSVVTGAGVKDGSGMFVIKGMVRDLFGATKTCTKEAATGVYRVKGSLTKLDMSNKSASSGMNTSHGGWRKQVSYGYAPHGSQGYHWSPNSHGYKSYGYRSHGYHRRHHSFHSNGYRSHGYHRRHHSFHSYGNGVKHFSWKKHSSSSKSTGSMKKHFSSKKSAAHSFQMKKFF